MNRSIHLLALSLLLAGCPKEKAASGVDAFTTPDSQISTDGATDAVGESDVTMDLTFADKESDAEGSAVGDSTPDVAPADMVGAPDAGTDAIAFTYQPADPCAEEPPAPAEGSTCTTLDELLCSDFEQKADTSFTYQTSVGSHVAQVCKRLHVLRCESATSGLTWVRHLAADLVGAETLAAAVKSEGIWCMSSKSGVSLEPGVCDNPDENGKSFKACAPSMAGMLGCSGTGLGTCGTPEMVDALVSGVPGTYIPPNMSATKRLGENYSFCSSFSRRYIVASCPQRAISCKYTKPNGEYYFHGFPSKCIIDDDTGAHCATTCTEIGMEEP